MTNGSGLMELGYNTNGLADLTPVQAIELLSDIGYAGIAITLDRRFLNPFAPDFQAHLRQVGQALSDRQFRSVIETGARFLLDPAIKHEPTLISSSPDGRARRIDFLCRAIDIASELRAECVSLWSGKARDGVDDRESMTRLVDGLLKVLDHAASRDVVVAFEPEPEMFIDTMSCYADLLEELEIRGAELSRFQIALDIGHLHCQGEAPIADKVRRWGDRLATVHIEDMRAGVHEHLMFGEGEIDFPPVIAALGEIGYSGLINVELSRHAQEGPNAARRAFDFLKPLIDAAAEATGR